MMSNIDPIPVEEPVVEAVETPEIAPVEPIDPADDIELRARSQGWRPLDEFNKDPSEWRDATEFLEISAHEMPVMRERLRMMEKTQLEMGAAMEFQKKERDVAVREERNRIETQYNARLRDTVVSGDEAGFDRIQREKDELLRTSEPVEPNLPPAVKDFMDENEWYGADENMTEFAEAQNIVIRRRHPEWNDDLVMRQLKAQVRQTYPQKFSVQNARQVEGGRRPIAQTKSNTFDNLPVDYKMGFDQSVKAGLLKDDEAGRARFAEIYYKDAAP